MSDERVSPAEFSRRVQMMISLLTEPPQSYGQEAQAIWGNIRDDLPHDYRQQVLISAFRSFFSIAAVTCS